MCVTPKPLTRLKRKITVENLWMYVIASLAVNPTHAYGIKKTIENLFNFKPTTITLYAVVYKLKNSGLIKERNPGEKVYVVTDEGLQELLKAIEFMEKTTSRLKEVINSLKLEKERSSE